MEGFLRTLLSFPAVPFTVLLGIALLYWLFVMLGVVAFDGDGALEGGLKAAGDAVGGGVKAAGDAAVGGVKSVGDAVLGGPKAVAEGVDAKAGAGDGVLSVLGFGKVPSTISGSLLVFFGWVFAMFGSSLLGADAHLLAKAGVLFGAWVASMAATSVAVRPLVKAFHSAPPQRRHHFIGKVCEITSGKVDGRFGTATVRDGGAGLNLNVTCGQTNALKKGDAALIIDFDEASETWLIEPMDWLEPSEVELLKDPQTAGQVISSRMRTRG